MLSGFNSRLGYLFTKVVPKGVHIDLLTPSLCTKEKPQPGLNVQSVVGIAPQLTYSKGAPQARCRARLRRRKGGPPVCGVALSGSLHP